MSELPEIPGLSELFVKMVERYAALWHNGRVPEGQARVEFIARILKEYSPDTDRQLTGVFTVEEWLKHQDMIATHLATACDCVARSQAARWQN